MATIFHLDLDAFFVSVERILNPQLVGKPVIVGGDPRGRGVVTTCSYEARKFGLHSAMPIRQAFKLCPDGLFIRGHYEEYSRFSHIVGDILRDMAPQIQQASIDEYYMDFTGFEHIEGGLLGLATKIQKRIKNEIFLPSSIGIAPNKTLAKIASDFRKPLGITYVLPGQEAAFLSNLPLSVIPGVGKMMIQKLNGQGFYKIRDVAKVSPDFMMASYGKGGIDLWNTAHGEGSTVLSTGREQKSISKETTFSDDVLDIKILENILFGLTGKVCQTLRDQKMVASTITLKLRYTDFVTITRSKTVEPTDDDEIVFGRVTDMLEKAFTRRVSVRLIGVGLSKFSHSGEQVNLFESEIDKRKNLLKAVNAIRGKYGYETISVGAVVLPERKKREP
jgi:DNA polymerase-4